MPHDLVSSITSRASCHFSTCPTSSSTISAVGVTTCCIRQARRARTYAASHGLVVMKWARACRLPSSPSRAAIGSTDLRRPSSNRPRR